MRFLCAAAATAAAGLALPLLATPANAAPALQFTFARYDSPGADRPTTNAKLNGEYVVIKNKTRIVRVLTNWTVRDRSNHVYRFGNFMLLGGRTVTIYTGRGRNTLSKRYWGQRNYVWNNSNDAAILRNPRGGTVDTCSWRRTGRGYTYC